MLIESGLRSAKAIVVLGGSEEIMNDLAIKMASRLMPNLWLIILIKLLL